MGLEFIGRVIKTSLVIAGIILIFGSVYYDWNYSLGITIGLMFNIANLWILTGLIRNTITPTDRKPLPIILFSIVKFPVLYFVGYMILKLEIVPVTSLLTGFILLFAIIVLKVVGRQLTNSEWMKLADTKKGASQ